MFKGRWSVFGARRLWLRGTVGTAILIVLMLTLSQFALAQQGSPPATPARPTVASVAHSSVSITWTDPRDSSITGYQVLRRIPAIHGPGEFVVIEEDTDSSETSYEDTDVEPETKYVYRVKARNAHGLSGSSGFVKATTPAELALTSARPGRPTVASVAHNSVSITWTDPGDSGITGYQVLRRNPTLHDTGVFEVLEDDTGSADTSYTDTSVEPETKYVYRVKARNAHGLSEWSRALTVTTTADPTPPNTSPTGLPTITGAALAGQTLSADTSSIGDVNGLTNAQFTYQWIRSTGGTDADISGATGQTYTLTSSDHGSTVKVSVSFTDDDGYFETLTSASTGTVATLVRVAVPDSDPAVAQQQQQQPAQSTSEPEDEDFASDNSTAGWLVVGGYGDGAMASLSGGSDIDAFKINLDAGKRYRIGVLTNGPRDYAIGGTYPGKPELQVRELDGSIGTNFERLNGFGEKSPSDTTIANVINIAGGPDNGARSEFDVLMTGTYLVKVIADGSSSTGTYTVKASEITSEQAYDRDFTSGWNGGRIKIDDKNAMTGTISEGRDRDWYLALLEAGKCYAFHVKGDHSDADHDGGTLGDPELKIMNFYDYYSMRFYDSDTLEFVGVQDHEETAEYYDMTYINPTHFKILGRADKVCSTVRPYDQPNISKTICNYYCDDNSGQGKNALIKVRVNTGGEGDYQIGVKGQGSTGTYSVFVEEIDCPTG